MSLRANLALVLERTGMHRAVLGLRRRTQSSFLAIVNYHRVHSPFATTALDEEVLDATPESFDRRIRTLKRHFSFIDLKQLQGFFQGEKLPPNPAMITFDDGYLDCYERAMPILQRHGVRATFFISTDYVQQRRLFWWDQICWLLKHARRPRFTLQYPYPLTVRLDTDARQAANHLIGLVKEHWNLDLDRFLEELIRASGAPWTRALERRLANAHVMSWDQVRALRKAGMDIGSHTCSHRVLQTLAPEELGYELKESRARLEEQLGEPIVTLAYPDGRPLQSDQFLRQAIRQAGYDLGFTLQTGSQPLWGKPDPYDIRRYGFELNIDEALFMGMLAFPSLAWQRKDPPIRWDSPTRPNPLPPLPRPPGPGPSSQPTQALGPELATSARAPKPNIAAYGTRVFKSQSAWPPAPTPLAGRSALDALCLEPAPERVRTEPAEPSLEELAGSMLLGRVSQEPATAYLTAQEAGAGTVSLSGPMGAKGRDGVPPMAYEKLGWKETALEAAQTNAAPSGTHPSSAWLDPSQEPKGGPQVPSSSISELNSVLRWAKKGPLPAVVLGDLTLIRPLGLASIPVLLATSDPKDVSVYCRYVLGHFSVPGYIGPSQAESAATLLDVGARIKQILGQRVPLIYGDDAHLEMLYTFRKELSEYYLFVLNEPELAWALNDKELFSALCEQKGVLAPRTVRGEAVKREILSQLRPPLLVKPKRKANWNELKHALFEGKGKARRFSSAEELIAHEGFQAFRSELIVQEFIESGVRDLYSFHGFCDERGQLLAHYCGQKIGTYPRFAGESSLIELIHDPDLTRTGIRVVEQLGLKGPFKIDLVKEPRSQSFYTLEVNARFNLWHYLGAVNGVNLPAIAYDYLVHGRRPLSPPSYELRHRWMNFYREYRAYRERSLGQPLYRWLGTLCSGPVVFETFAWQDPKPFVHWVGRLLSEKVKR